MKKLYFFLTIIDWPHRADQEYVTHWSLDASVQKLGALRVIKFVKKFRISRNY